MSRKNPMPEHARKDTILLAILAVKKNNRDLRLNLKRDAPKGVVKFIGAKKDLIDHNLNILSKLEALYEKANF